MHRTLLAPVLVLVLTAWLRDRGRVTRPIDEAVAAWLRATLQMKSPTEVPSPGVVQLVDALLLLCDGLRAGPLCLLSLGIWGFRVHG